VVLHRESQRRGSALAEQMRSALGGRRGLFEVPFTRSSERNKFHSRADEGLSAFPPKRVSRPGPLNAAIQIKKAAGFKFG